MQANMVNAMEKKEKSTEATETEDKEQRSWFNRWIDNIMKTEQWYESSSGCLDFPYSCY